MVNGNDPCLPKISSVNNAGTAVSISAMHSRRVPPTRISNSGKKKGAMTSWSGSASFNWETCLFMTSGSAREQEMMSQDAPG